MNQAQLRWLPNLRRTTQFQGDCVVRHLVVFNADRGIVLRVVCQVTELQALWQRRLSGHVPEVVRLSSCGELHVPWTNSAFPGQALRPNDSTLDGTDSTLDGTPLSAGPESVGPESASPESAGPESAGPESAGPESAGPESAGPESLTQEQTT